MISALFVHVYTLLAGGHLHRMTCGTYMIPSSAFSGVFFRGQPLFLVPTSLFSLTCYSIDDVFRHSVIVKPEGYVGDLIYSLAFV